MFTNEYRHHAYWGAPAQGYWCDSPRMEFGPRPMHHGNPFASFMGGFFGGLAASSFCGWGNSYVGYPSASVSPVSIFQRSYSPYQSYSSLGYTSFGCDYSALALNDAYSNFLNSFSMPRYMTAQTQTQPSSYWSTPTSGWATSIPSQTWSQPFSSLTQSSRQSGAYSVIPTKPKSQPSAQAGTSQPQGSVATGAYSTIPVKNTATANQGSQSGTTSTGTSATTAEAPPSVQTVDTGSANVTEIRSGDKLLIIGDASKSGVKPSIVENATQLKVQALVPFKQKLDSLMDGLNQTSQPSIFDVDTHLHNSVVQYRQLALSIMDKIEERGTDPSSDEIESLNEKLNSVAEVVKKYQDAYPTAEEVAKKAAQAKVDEEAFNATCKGGDCGDKNDRQYYDKKTNEWTHSTTKGYAKQPIAPESGLVNVEEPYKAIRNMNSNSPFYSTRINPEPYSHFKDMARVAGDTDNLELAIAAGFRSFENQKAEFDFDQMKIKAAMANGEKFKVLAAPPGYTEHHTGNTIDVANNGHFGNRDEWMADNAKYFGFERSYPPNSLEAQGVEPEGWHWRFNPELLKTANIPQTEEEASALVAEMNGSLSKAIPFGNEKAVRQEYKDLNDKYIRFLASPEELRDKWVKPIANKVDADTTVITYESDEVITKTYERWNRLKTAVREYNRAAEAKRKEEKNKNK